MTRDCGRFPPLVLATFLLCSVSGCIVAKPNSPKAAGPSLQSADIVPFPGAAAPAPNATAAPAPAGYTLDTPIEQIAADPQGRAVLNKDIPGLLANPNYPMFKGMSLKTVASLSRGKLDQQTLAQTQADLAALPKEASLAK